MLCFESLCLGVIGSTDKKRTYELIQRFTQEYPELIKQIAVQHPEYFADGSIVETCIRALPQDILFQENLRFPTGIKDFQSKQL